MCIYFTILWQSLDQYGWTAFTLWCNLHNHTVGAESSVVKKFFALKQNSEKAKPSKNIFKIEKVHIALHSQKLLNSFLLVTFQLITIFHMQFLTIPVSIFISTNKSKLLLICKTFEFLNKMQWIELILWWTHLIPPRIVS